MISSPFGVVGSYVPGPNEISSPRVTATASRAAVPSSSRTRTSEKSAPNAVSIRARTAPGSARPAAGAAVGARRS